MNKLFAMGIKTDYALHSQFRINWAFLDQRDMPFSFDIEDLPAPGCESSFALFDMEKQRFVLYPN
jgi:hypothetical protein